MAFIKFEQEQLRSIVDKVGSQYLKSMIKALPFEDFSSKVSMYAADPSNHGKPEIGITPTSFSFPKSQEDLTVRIAPDLTVLHRALSKAQQDIDDELSKLPANTHVEAKKILNKKIIEPLIKTIIFTRPPKLKNSKGEEIPVWYNKTTRGINIRIGYLDGDSSKPTPIIFNDDMVHMLAGGITGSGKSVLINTILANLMHEYPPHELRLWLCDFKKVELSRYAVPVKTPHAFVVAATESPDYMISLFKELQAEHQRMQDILTFLGIEHIRDLEANYNFIVPRNLLLVDEFVQLFENVKEDPDAKKKIEECISDIARRGRNAGYHMLLSSQSLGGVLSDQIAKQFKGGIALMSDASTSKELIKNPQASTIQTKGIAYANTGKDPSEKGNRMYQVPYISSDVDKAKIAENLRLIEAMSSNPEEAEELSNSIANSYLADLISQFRAIADESGDFYDLKYFEQDAQSDWSRFEKLLPNLKKQIDARYAKDPYMEQMFVLGDISQYRGSRNIEYFSVGSESNGNIGVFADSADNMYYGIKLMYTNLSRLSPVTTQSFLVASDPVFTEQYIKDKHFQFNQRFREFPYDHYTARVNSRKRIVGMNQLINDSLKPISLKSVLDAQEEMGTVLSDTDFAKAKEFVGMYGECEVTKGMQSIQQYAEQAGAGIALTNLPQEDLEAVDGLFHTALTLLNLRNEKGAITSRAFPRCVYYVVGLDKEDSIASPSADTQKLKGMFKEGTQYGIFCVFASTGVDGIARIRTCFGYILERTESTDILPQVELKKHKYYGDHFMRFVRMKDKSNSTYVFKKYRIDMNMELGYEMGEETDLEL